MVVSWFRGHVPHRPRSRAPRPFSPFIFLIRADEQVKLVFKVKSYENGFISNPAVMAPHNTVSDLDELKAERNISGEAHNNCFRSSPHNRRNFEKYQRHGDAR